MYSTINATTATTVLGFRISLHDNLKDKKRQKIMEVMSVANVINNRCKRQSSEPPTEDDVPSPPTLTYFNTSIGHLASTLIIEFDEPAKHSAFVCR